MKFPKFKAIAKSSRPPPPEIGLLVYEETLIHLGAGRHCGLAEADDLRRLLHPERVAEAARRLLPPETEGHVGLYLPAHEFVATSVRLPGVDADNLANAARLQLPMLLPGIAEPMLLAIHSGGMPRDATHLAVWLPQARAEGLFAAFRSQGLFLAWIVPRPLAALPKDGGPCHVYDQDRHTLTYLEWDGDAARRWHYLPAEEADIPAFREQFEQAVGGESTAPVRRFAALEDWTDYPLPPAGAYRYGLLPLGAARQIEALRRRRRLSWLIGGAAALALLAVMAIAGALSYEYYLERRLAELRQQTADVSRLRAEIMQIEERAGPVRAFPRQDVAGILRRLNQLIPKDSWITALKIEAGVIEFEGQSQNPATILETLTAQPDFAGVAFSKPIQGQHFGISFHLAGMDVPAYMRQYFPSDAERQ